MSKLGIVITALFIGFLSGYVLGQSDGVHDGRHDILSGDYECDEHGGEFFCREVE